jgi:hypothetical protein
MKTIKHNILISLTLLVSFILCDIVNADVTLERFTQSSGFGGVGANEATSITQISGLKKREKMNMKLTGSLGKFVTKMGGPMETDSITDIDKDVVWTLDHKKKTYTENKISLEMEKMKGQPATKEEEEEKEEKPKVKIIRNEFSVKETGEKKTINGFNCKKYLLIWLVETEDIETKEHAKNTMTSELWNTELTKELNALQKEEMEFNQAYLKKLGIEMSPEEAQKFGLGMMSGFLGTDEKATEENMKKLTKELSKVRGYTIASNIKWEHESDSMKKQKEESAKKEKMEEPEEEESEDVDVSQGIGGFLGGVAKKAATKKIKEEKKKKEAEEKEKNKGKENVVFESYTEIKKISTSKIPQSEFSVPAGYKLVK